MTERHDECDPHMPLWMSRCNWMSSSLEIHFIIMPLVPLLNNTPSIRWYSLDLRAIRLTSALSSDGGWFSRNILIGCIQSYAGSSFGSSMTIRSGSIASLVDSSSLTEGVDNYSIMMSGEVVALEEAIQARWFASWLPRVGHTELQTRQKTSPSCALMLDTQSAFHYCNHILFALAWLLALNLPW
jgi:hypothetical protein